MNPDHPYTDPGDGRVECETCGKWVHLVIHSSKRTRDSPSHLGCPDLERALVEVERLEAIEYEARIVTQELRARNARLESLAASRLRRIHELTNVKEEGV